MKGSQPTVWLCTPDRAPKGARAGDETMVKVDTMAKNDGLLPLSEYSWARPQFAPPQTNENMGLMLEKNEYEYGVNARKERMRIWDSCSKETNENMGTLKAFVIRGRRCWSSSASYITQL